MRMEGNDVLPLEPKLSLHGDLRERKEIRIRRIETLIFIVVSHALLGVFYRHQLRQVQHGYCENDSNKCGRREEIPYTFSLTILLVFHYINCRKQCILLSPNVFCLLFPIAALEIGVLKPMVAWETIENLFGSRYDDHYRNQCRPNDAIESRNLVEYKYLDGEGKDDIATLADEGRLGGLA